LFRAETAWAKPGSFKARRKLLKAMNALRKKEGAAEPMEASS
jgi:hypothetical protein